MAVEFQQHGQRRGLHLVVVDDEKFFVLLRRPGFSLRLRFRRQWSLRHQRQPDDEYAAAINSLAMGLDAAAVQIDQVFDQGKADAEAAALGGALSLAEHFKCAAQ